MMPELVDQKVLQSYLKEKKLALVEKISKGCSGEIFLVKNSAGKKFALKMERKDSTREKMVEREAANLKLANSVDIGPKLVEADFRKRIILYEFIEGTTFNKWLNSLPKKEDLKNFLRELFAQAEKLDEIGLDHGQLAGKGANILVDKNLRPVIVDFEKASPNRRCHNVTQLASFAVLNKHSGLTQKILSLLRGEKIEEMKNKK